MRLTGSDLHFRKAILESMQGVGGRACGSSSPRGRSQEILHSGERGPGGGNGLIIT